MTAYFSRFFFPENIFDNSHYETPFSKISVEPLCSALYCDQLHFIYRIILHLTPAEISECKFHIECLFQHLKLFLAQSYGVTPIFIARKKKKFQKNNVVTCIYCSILLCVLLSVSIQHINISVEQLVTSHLFSDSPLLQSNTAVH